jgi:DNA integrity scanning protein DisA with diadenylate cyclase activity
MGLLEESKVAQVINRFEDTRTLLNDVNAVDNRFNEKISKIIQTLEGYEKELGQIKEQLNVENLGIKERKSPSL